MHHIHTWVTIIPPSTSDGKGSKSYRHYHQKVYTDNDGTVKLHLTHDGTEHGDALYRDIHTVHVTPMRRANKPVDVPHAAIDYISDDMKTLSINAVIGTMGHAHSMMIAPKTCLYVTIMGENNAPMRLINGVIDEIKE